MDPWISNPTRRQKAIALDWYENLLERFVISRADWVIANTPELKEDFCIRYPKAADKIGVITCGFDPGDFTTPREEPVSDVRQTLTITHTGTLYAMRNPVNILKGFAMLLEEGRADRDRIKLKFVGDLTLVSAEAANLVDSLQQQNVLELFPRLPYEEALRILDESDIALIVQPVTKLQIPAKLYEYASSMKPIFAVAEAGGAVERIVLDNEWGMAVADEPNVIKDELASIYEKFISGQPLANYDADIVNRYSYPELAREFILQTRALL